MNKWKVTAIVFIVLFLALLSFNIWGYYLITQETKDTIECYYDVCEGYPEAYFDAGVCTCYDYGEDGNFKIVDISYID